MFLMMVSADAGSEAALDAVLIRVVHIHCTFPVTVVAPGPGRKE
jgi:hypothetical protein